MQYKYLLLNNRNPKVKKLNGYLLHYLLNKFRFDSEYVSYCTTKYIFWLGKNKFDRMMPFQFKPLKWQITVEFIKQFIIKNHQL